MNRSLTQNSGHTPAANSFFGALLALGVLFIIGSLLPTLGNEQMPPWLVYSCGFFGAFLILWVLYALSFGQYRQYCDKVREIEVLNRTHLGELNKLNDEKRDIQNELDTIKTITQNDVFDWSARDVANYVMAELALTLPRANHFVRQMFLEGKVQMRAIKKGDLIPSSIPTTIFTDAILQDTELHLIGTDLDRQYAQHFEGAFHENGWIDKSIRERNESSLLYEQPRFIKGEVVSTVTWYGKSHPIVPDMPLGQAIEFIRRKPQWSDKTEIAI